MKKILKFSNSEKFLKCPICYEDLVLNKMSLYCTNKHCFDVSNSGYVNLILNNRKQTYNKDAYLNRRAVFNIGYYSHILQEVINILVNINTVNTILDVGCGEGYYSREIYNKLRKEIIAFDISKDSIQMASKFDLSDSIKWFVGDLTQLPIKDNWNHKKHEFVEISSLTIEGEILLGKV